jgi:hypothetical protein
LPDDIDHEKYIAIPDKVELDLGKPLVLDFAREFLPDDYNEVCHIFSRRGAYRRYKDLLVRRGALERWYDFRTRPRKRLYGSGARRTGSTSARPEVMLLLSTVALTKVQGTPESIQLHRLRSGREAIRTANSADWVVIIRWSEPNGGNSKIRVPVFIKPISPLRRPMIENMTIR